MIWKTAGNIIGRFPIVLNEVSKCTDEEKREYVFEKIKDIDKAIYNFILNAPDGTLRILGPYKRKKGETFVIASPFSQLFKHLLILMPKYFNCRVSSDNQFTEIIEINDLFENPGRFYVISDANVHLSQSANDILTFLGLKVNPKVLPIEYRKLKEKRHYVFAALTRETSAAVRILRYTGVGENRMLSNADVVIYRLDE